MQITDFIHFVSSKKSSLKDWSYLYAKVPTARFGEARQLLDFCLGGAEIQLVEISPKCEFLLVTSNANAAALAQFEKGMSESFEKDVYELQVRGLAAKGLDQINDYIKPHINGNELAALSLLRMCRPANTVIVLDDDVMSLRIIQNVLGGMGHIVATQTEADFFTNYRKYAPNITFIDIHLRDGASGTGVLQKLLKEVDPNAHVIMISSDRAETTIASLKGKGAKGFVLKPIKNEALLTQLAKTPTFHARDQ